MLSPPLPNSSASDIEFHTSQPTIEKRSNPPSSPSNTITTENENGEPSHSFTLFSQLPSELQNLIWTFTLPTKRLVFFSRVNARLLSEPIPIVHACRDSRQIAISVYKIVAYSSCLGIVPFDDASKLFPLVKKKEGEGKDLGMIRKEGDNDIPPPPPAIRSTRPFRPGSGPHFVGSRANPVCPHTPYILSTYTKQPAPTNSRPISTSSSSSCSNSTHHPTSIHYPSPLTPSCKAYMLISLTHDIFTLSSYITLHSFTRNCLTNTLLLSSIRSLILTAWTPWLLPEAEADPESPSGRQIAMLRTFSGGRTHETAMVSWNKAALRSFTGLEEVWIVFGDDVKRTAQDGRGELEEFDVEKGMAEGKNQRREVKGEEKEEGVGSGEFEESSIRKELEPENYNWLKREAFPVRKELEREKVNWVKRKAFASAELEDIKVNIKEGEWNVPALRIGRLQPKGIDLEDHAQRRASFTPWL